MFRSLFWKAPNAWMSDFDKRLASNSCNIIQALKSLLEWIGFSHKSPLQPAIKGIMLNANILLVTKYHLLNIFWLTSMKYSSAHPCAASIQPHRDEEAESNFQLFFCSLSIFFKSSFEFLIAVCCSKAVNLRFCCWLQVQHHGKFSAFQGSST